MPPSMPQAGSRRATRAAPRSSGDTASRAGVAQLRLGEAAGEHGDVSRPARSAASQSQVESPTITASPPPAFSTAALHEVGLWLGGLHVVGGGPGVDQVAGVEQVEVVVDLVLLRRAGQHHRVASSLEIGDQLARARERLDLADQLAVERALCRADVVALLALELLAAERLDELVAAHPDVPVDAPDRQQHPVLAEGPVPGDRVLVVGVDERAVDVEDRCGWHPATLPAERSPKRGRTDVQGGARDP